MSLKFNVIAGCCENMGMGKDGTLPWNLNKEMEYYTTITTKTQDAGKKNVIIMGSKSWDALPEEYKPFENRFNFVLSSRKLDVSSCKDTFVFSSWDEIVNKLNDADFKQKYEEVWVCGGRKTYEDAMKSDRFYRLYLSKIKKDFECDIFFPKLGDNLKKTSDDRVPQGVQSENGIDWEYEVYENANFK